MLDNAVKMLYLVKCSVPLLIDFYPSMKIVITKISPKQFYISIKSNNGAVLFRSYDFYTTRTAALRTVKILKEKVKDAYVEG